MCERCAVEKDIYLPRLATLEKKRLMNPTEMYLRLTLDDSEPIRFYTGAVCRGLASRGSGRRR